MSEVTLRTFEPRRYAALAHKGAYSGIGATFERLAVWAEVHGLADAMARRVAVYYDNDRLTPEADLRADACLCLPDTTPLDGGVRWIEVKGGTYAIAEHRGLFSGLPETYRRLFTEELPQSGRHPGEGPCLEVYVTDCRTTPQRDAVVEIQVPLA